MEFEPGGALVILVDSHVHVYPVYEPEVLLKAGRDNLRCAAEDSGLDAGEAIFVMCLAERDDCGFFADLTDGKIRLKGSYSIEHSGDPEGLWLCDGDDFRVLLVAGRQWVSACRLEVLALTADTRIRSGEKLEQMIPAVQEAGAIPVLPWAPGKWMGARGKAVYDWISRNERHGALLADTSFRPAGWKEPAQFSAARVRGIPVLAGTDPLPLRGEETKVGTYCQTLDGELDAIHPVQSLRKLIAGGAPEPRTIGARRSLPEVMGKQIALRFQ